MSRLKYLYNAQIVAASVCVICFILLALNFGIFSSVDALVQVLVAGQTDMIRGLAIVITTAGDQIVLVPLVIVASLAQLKYGTRAKALLMLASAISLPLFYICKITIERARPVTEFVTQAGLSGYSFPSGHATTSFVIYATLAYLLYARIRRPWSGIMVFVLGALILLIGFSRVYLGAHYPSDVFGGWLLGSAIFLIITFVYNEVVKKKEVVSA